MSLLLGGATAFGSWETDYEKAIAIANDEGKYVLIDFTGSDWCPPCIKLKKDVFDKVAFKNYANENLVLIEIDSPRRGKLDKRLSEQNDRLKQKYKVKGFPTVVILNPEGKEINRRVGYGSAGVAEYLKYIESSITSY